MRLLIARYSLVNDLLPIATYHLLPTTYHLPRATYDLLPTTYYLLPPAYYSPRTAYCAADERAAGRYVAVGGSCVPDGTPGVLQVPLASS